MQSLNISLGFNLGRGGSSVDQNLFEKQYKVEFVSSGPDSNHSVLDPVNGRVATRNRRARR